MLCIHEHGIGGYRVFLITELSPLRQGAYSFSVFQGTLAEERVDILDSIFSAVGIEEDIVIRLRNHSISESMQYVQKRFIISTVEDMFSIILFLPEGTKTPLP